MQTNTKVREKVGEPCFKSHRAGIYTYGQASVLAMASRKCGV